MQPTQLSVADKVKIKENEITPYNKIFMALFVLLLALLRATKHNEEMQDENPDEEHQNNYINPNIAK